MTKYEFDQGIAEAVHYLGKELVFTVLDGVAKERGWPIPEEFWPEVIIPLCYLKVGLDSINEETKH